MLAMLAVVPCFAQQGGFVGPGGSGTFPNPGAAGTAPISDGAGHYTATPVPTLGTGSLQAFSGPITTPSFNNLANLAGQSGSAGTGQLNTWIAAAIGAGTRSYLWADPQATSGAPSSALSSLTRLIDARGTNCMDQDGNFSYADNALCIEAAEDSQDSSTITTDKADLHLGYDSKKGGAYTYNGVTGTKSNRSVLAFNGDFRTVSQKWGAYEFLNSYTNGETIGYSCYITEWGGYESNGQETDECVRSQMQQTNDTDTTGGTWNATATSVSSGQVNFTVNSNGNDLGEGRFIRDLGSKYSVGTVASVACSGSSPVTCTLTGSGTSWTSISGFVGTHTTYNGLSTGGPILTNNLVLCFDPLANDGYDFCMPINQGVSDTSLTINLASVGVQQNQGWPAGAATTGTYSIYGSSYPTTVDVIADNFLAADISGLTNGHTLDQVIAYNQSGDGYIVLQSRHIGVPYQGNGIIIQNTSDSTAPLMDAGVAVSGGYLAAVLVGENSLNSGTPAYGIDFLKDPTGSLINFGVTSSTSNLSLFNYFNSANTPRSLMSIVRNTGDAYGIDYLSIYPNIGSGTLYATADGRVSVAGTPQSGQLFNVGGTSDDFGVNSAGQVGINVAPQSNVQFDVTVVGGATYGFTLTQANPLSVGYSMFDIRGGGGANYSRWIDNGSGVLGHLLENGLATTGYSDAGITRTYQINAASGLATFDGGVAACNSSSGDCATLQSNGSLAVTLTAPPVTGTLVTGPSTSTVGDITTYGGTQGQTQDSGVALSALAPLASPALSGTPTAPTAAIGTNTTQVATMAAVQAAVGLTQFEWLAPNANTDSFSSLGNAATFCASVTGAWLAANTNRPVSVSLTSAAISGDCAGWTSTQPAYNVGRQPLQRFGVAYSATADYSSADSGVIWLGLFGTCTAATMEASGTPTGCDIAALRYVAGTDSTYQCVTSSSTGSLTATPITGATPSTTFAGASIIFNSTGTVTCTVGGISVTTPTTNVPASTITLSDIFVNVANSANAVHVYLNGVKGFDQNSSF